MHVVRHHETCLDGRQNDQDRDRLEMRNPQTVDVQLGESHDRKDAEDDLVGALPCLLMGACGLRCRSRRHSSPQIRYTIVKRKIQTTSTKCQYNPTSSTASRFSFVNPPLNAFRVMYAIASTPAVTWEPWTPVCAQNVR